MKIYIVPIDSKFQKPFRGYRFPAHNKNYDTEQDFYRYLIARPELIADTPEEANWYYLPFFWSQWHFSHFDRVEAGLKEMQDEVNRVMLDERKTFTVCQYDDGPLVSIGKSVQFLACRKTIEGIDVPLLCEPHRKPLFPPQKKYFASFVGEVRNHPMRAEFIDRLGDFENSYITGTKAVGTQAYVNNILESYIALCPRGYGGNSFRFFEAMQLAVVPFSVGDLDTRPFKHFLNWDEMSFHASSVEEMEKMLNGLKNEKEKLIQMGQKAKSCWEKELRYQKWCFYLIKELERITPEVKRRKEAVLVSC